MPSIPLEAGVLSVCGEGPAGFGQRSCASHAFCQSEGRWGPLGLPAAFMFK